MPKADAGEGDHAAETGAAWNAWPSWLTSVAQQLGRPLDLLDAHRGKLLILLGSIYVTGYATWSIHANLNGLGVLPVLDAQYFTAGIVPIALIGFGYLVAVNTWDTGTAFGEWLKTTTSRSNRRIFGQPMEMAILQSMQLVIVIILPIFGTLPLWIPIEYSQLQLWIIVTGLSFMMTLVVALSAANVRIEDDHDAVFRRIMLSTITILSIVLVAFFSLGFVRDIFPLIPQALGGGSSTCVQLDVRRSALSSNTAHWLFSGVAEAESASETGQVGRTRNLELLGSRGDRLLLRADGELAELDLSVVSATIISDGCGTAGGSATRGDEATPEAVPPVAG